MPVSEPPGAGALDAVVTQQVADIARVLLSPGSVGQILDRIVTLAVASIDGCADAGLCSVSTDSLHSARGSALMIDLDQRQTALAEGPCPDALGGVDCVYAADLGDDPRWPAFGPIAAAAGLRSVLAYRLFAGTETLGALQLYAHLPAEFNAAERAQGLLFATHAGIALQVAEQQAAQSGRTDHLEAALVSREVIGQAQGILMERERITATQAFDLLRRSSQQLNLKLRDVAQELVDTGSVPGGDQGTTGGSGRG